MLGRLLDFIMPEDCIECGQEGVLWCEGCRLSGPLLPSRCFLCHVATSNFEVCQKCKNKTKVRRMYIAKEYKDSAKDIVHALKYHPKRHAAQSIASTITDMLPMYNPTSTLVVNIPTASQRVRQRGFDHTAHIAKSIAREKGLLYRNVLIRIGSSRQVGAQRSARLAQAKQSYRLRQADCVRGFHIIVIDDVVTTGATVSEVCTVLLQAGARSVDCAAFAYST